MLITTYKTLDEVMHNLTASGDDIKGTKELMIISYIVTCQQKNY